jgi:hypothetical protein
MNDFPVLMSIIKSYVSAKVSKSVPSFSQSRVKLSVLPRASKNVRGISVQLDDEIVDSIVPIKCATYAKANRASHRI